MKSRILRALSHTEGYVSGQELCEELEVSRTAVWKVINQLKEEGYEIESVPRKGYRILKRPDTITAEEVGSRIETKWAGKTIYSLETVDSTNNEASRLAENGAAEGTLVLAEEQGKGKGRRGRSWVTPAGSAVAMSLVVRPQIPPSRASMMTLVMGLAVAYGCRDCCGVETGIKWPNDIVVDGKKICGILTEMSSEIDYIKYLVIGAGINTNIESFPPELQQKAVSLHQITGSRPDRAALIAACMKRFEEFYEAFLETQDFSLLRKPYNDLLIGIGSKVRVLEPGNEYDGISEGIDEMGELLVRREDGTLEKVYAGEVSVRGIYGYV
ncbi:MAG: biotin--[acetyl-CoA-carboxylase] ligase [Lachnospiraceae bacterium]|nr:biotin--[acetyl-CoA-carboxylase] ligase [Lachnospiraceae bacterium]